MYWTRDILSDIVQQVYFARYHVLYIVELSFEKNGECYLGKKNSTTVSDWC